MDNLNLNLPQSKRLLLGKLLSQLSTVPGVAAIVLGGSYASGTHYEGSDVDLGLYYYDSSPFSIEDIQAIADTASIKGPATVTGFYGWGAWVNGGAWIHTAEGRFDFIYRSIDHVQRTITEAHEGIVRHDYGQQPAYGFYSVIYLAETHICIPLHDPGSVIDKLKQQVEVYPPKLKRAIVGDALWSAEFTLLFASKFSAQGDVYNTVGCLTRTSSALTQVLFALNERYFIRDKKVMDTIAGFPICPDGYAHKIKRILACPGSTADELSKTVREIEQAWRSVVELSGELYQPKFQI